MDAARELLEKLGVQKGAGVVLTMPDLGSDAVADDDSGPGTDTAAFAQTSEPDTDTVIFAQTSEPENDTIAFAQTSIPENDMIAFAQTSEPENDMIAFAEEEKPESEQEAPELNEAPAEPEAEPEIAEPETPQEHVQKAAQSQTSRSPYEEGIMQSVLEMLPESRKPMWKQILSSVSSITRGEIDAPALREDFENADKERYKFYVLNDERDTFWPVSYPDQIIDPMRCVMKFDEYDGSAEVYI